MKASVLAFSARFGAAGEAPDVSILGPRLRRGLSVHQKLVVDAFTAVTRASDRASVPVVHGSELGELETAVFLATTPDPSPARFSVSVHSAVIGQIAIATGNRRGHVTLSAGRDTLAMALVEAMGALDAGEPEVVVVIADETSERLGAEGDEAFAFAFCLGAPRPGTPVVAIGAGVGVDASPLARRCARLSEALSAGVALELPPSRPGLPTIRLAPAELR